MLKEKSTKGVILKQKGARMAEQGEDLNGLKMAILLKKLGYFFSKVHERWRTSFKARQEHGKTQAMPKAPHHEG